MTLDENEVCCAELVLARYFTEIGKRQWCPVKDARKRLGIESQSFEGSYCWKWADERSPEMVWAEKSKNIFRGIQDA